MTAPTHPLPERRTHVRWFIVGMLFVVTTVNYADRATLSIVGPDLARELGLDPVGMGYVFSAFAWSYVLAQLPGGWLLDRWGAPRVYGWSIALWSVFTVLQGFVGGFDGRVAVVLLFGLRLLLGVAEAPSFPANARIVAAWFPTAERGTASAIFNSAQYFATVLFAPIMGWIVHRFGWEQVFWFMGMLGLGLAVAWPRLVRPPRAHPWANAAEVAHIAQGGGLVDLDHAGGPARPAAATAGVLRGLLGRRLLLGVFLGQYGITTLTWFFLTWFPIYLVRERGLTILQAGFVAALPALCGFAGGICGGWWSDRLLRRGWSLTAARKLPIVAGLLLSLSMVGCNYVAAPWAVVVLMSLAFFGKGVGALGWAVIADVAPRTATGLCGGLFNTFGNLAGIATPIVIGYILQATGSFHGALLYVGANAALAIVCYLTVVGRIERVELPAA